MRRTPATRAAVLAAILASIVVLGACRSDGSSSVTTTVRGSASTTTTPPTTASAPPVPAEPLTHGSLVVDGRERTYRLFVPADLPAGDVPLFIGLHGGTGWGDQFAATNHIESIAESEGFIVVHPDGVRIANGRGGVWNGGVCCGVAARDDIDDVAFIAALIDSIEATHQVDANRVYAFGHSNGGIVSYRLACELSDRIVGIGVVAGTLGIASCEPSRPVSVIHVHGSADQNLPLAGGVGSNSVAGVDFPPPLDGFAALAAADRCPAVVVTVAGALSTATRAPCADGTAAVFVTIDGAEHPWPGGTGPTSSAGGTTYSGFDATSEIVAFLLEHSRPS